VTGSEMLDALRGAPEHVLSMEARLDHLSLKVFGHVENSAGLLMFNI
jgi:hypothetical protein